ncbi:MAG: hypothetical protein NWS03_07065 [Flavobacteriaceae bacterium]|jgi:hypothetical protein|nr:hypothetical protein [Flavobacteriaceae bacterium]
MKEKCHFNHEDFEFPVVLTKYAIEHTWRPILLSHPGMLILDLKKNFDIFQEFIPPGYIKEYEVKYLTHNLLLQIANAYKWIDDDNLYALLVDFANKLRKKSLGGVISVGMYEDYVRSAMINKDTLILEPNKSIRYLYNPYYDYTGVPYDERKQFRIDNLNMAIGLEKRKDNYDTIYEAIVDYDLGQKRLTKRILESLTGLSYATIKNYLNEHSELELAYNEINRHSGTALQQRHRKYNQAKN